MLMRRLARRLWNVIRQGDWILLLACIAASAFGCVVIASATAHTGSSRYLVMQIGAIIMGIVSYLAVSAIDLDWVSEHRGLLVIFNIVLLLLLFPFGTDFNSGNRSWLQFPFLPFSIQPAELCKITFVLILASVMASHQQKISSFKSVFSMVFHMGLLVGVNMLVSHDAGVSLIFVFIFAGMAIAGGVHWLWVAFGGSLIAVGAPLVWKYLMDPYQKNRILVLFDPSIDPLGIGPRYHTKRSLLSLTGGGLTGQGLFQGNRTQIGALPAQHTDYIFSAIGEEMGFVGCFLVLVLLGFIIFRIVQIGSRSQNYLRRMVCFGAAMAMIFQICSNVGMCIGITPVIGLTLPFISYGGSSLLSLYAMLGLVSGVCARPAPKKHELYIRPY